MVSALTSLWIPSSYDLAFVVVVGVVFQQLAHLWTDKVSALMTNIIRKPSTKNDDIAVKARPVGEIQALRGEVYT